MWARQIWAGLLTPAVVALMVAALVAVQPVVEGWFFAALRDEPPGDVEAAWGIAWLYALFGVPIALVFGGPVGGVVAGTLLRLGPPTLDRAALAGAITALVCALIAEAVRMVSEARSTGGSFHINGQGFVVYDDGRTPAGWAYETAVFVAVGALAALSVWALLRPRP